MGGAGGVALTEADSTLVKSVGGEREAVKN